MTKKKPMKAKVVNETVWKSPDYQGSQKVYYDHKRKQYKLSLTDKVTGDTKECFVTDPTIASGIELSLTALLAAQKHLTGIFQMMTVESKKAS